MGRSTAPRTRGGPATHEQPRVMNGRSKLTYQVLARFGPTTVGCAGQAEDCI